MDGFETKTIHANGLDFAYVERGQGPLLLCFHGFPDTPASFRPQLETFARAGYRVVAPYMRGYPPTTIPDGPFQAAAFGQDAVALIEALGHERAIVYGHDWGSAAAYAAALIAPERIEKLIAAAVPYGPAMGRALVANGAQQRRSWYIFFFQTALADRAVPMNDFSFIDSLWADWSPGFAGGDEAIASVKQTLAQPGALAAALGYYRTIFDPSRKDPALDAVESRFGREPIGVPALYVHGARDGCIGVEVTEGMEPFFSKGLDRAVVPNAGHFVHLEAPDAFNERVLAFVRG